MTTLSIQQVADHLDATSAEVMGATSITLGEAMHAAELAGLDPEMHYRRVPLIEERLVELIDLRIFRERAELAAMRPVSTDRLTARASQYLDQVVIRSGVMSMFLEPDQARPLADQIGDALQVIADRAPVELVRNCAQVDADVAAREGL